MQDTRANRIIKYLKNTYTFKYTFSDDELKKYGFTNWNIKSEWLQKPIFFSPNKGKNSLTVMAFGGCIGFIPLDEGTDYFTFDKKKSMKAFARYLSPLENELYYKDGNGNLYYLPSRFVEKYSTDGFEEVKKLLRRRDNTIEQLLTNEKFIDMMVCAAYVRFMHRHEGKMLDIGERSMETIVSRYAWDNYENNNLVVIDIEYKPNLSCKLPSIDFVVLDKKNKSFGLVEFKYQGMSMNEKGSNSLSVHFNDFRNAILDKDIKRSVLNDIVENCTLLVEAGVLVGNEITNLLDEIKKDGIQDCLWCGFFFLDEKRILSTRKDIKGNVPLIERIEYDCKIQVVNNPKFADIIKNKKIDVRYQHSYLEDGIEIKMDEDMIVKFSQEYK